MSTTRAFLAAGAATLLLALSPGLAHADEAEADVRHAARNPVPGAYLITLKQNALTAAAAQSTAEAAVARYGGRLHSVYTRTMTGYAVEGLSERAARRIAARPEVASVAQSGTAGVGGAVTQPNPPNWGLDRIDQASLPLSKSYTYDDAAAGQGVTVYVVDTGIRFSHTEFEGRASAGTDLVVPSTNGSDCHGHGTHVSGIAAGKTYGVAKKAKLVSVRVLGCDGMGKDIDVSKAAEWVTANAVKPAVVNLSVYTDDKDIAAGAIRSSVQSGVQWSLITGNNGANACNHGPGGQVTEALQVGNSTSSDGKAGDSNYGTCMDLHAPGSNILSAHHGSDTATTTMSGTSMAAPHVAGAVATYLTGHPSATPAQVHSWVMDNASTGKLNNLPAGTPNKLLYVPTGGTEPPTGDYTLSASPTSATVQAGGSATTRITATATTAGPPQGVINGTPTTVAKYPFIISQHRAGGARPTEQSCTGSVVAKRIVLIAAHCKFAQGDKYLVYGRDDLADTNTGTRIEIAEYRTHPNYNASDGWRTGWDVAVIIAQSDIPTPAGMAYPAVARSGDTLPVGTRGTAVGYGKTDANDTNRNTKLNETVLPVADDQNCRTINNQFDARYMFCDGYGDNSTGLCQGDSGGPYLSNGKIYGVFSWLRTDCASYNAHGRLHGVMGDWANEQIGGTTPPTGDITLSASGLPSGATATFDPTTVSVGGSANLTVATSANTPAGTYPITVTGTKGQATAQTTFTLTVGSTTPTNLTLANPGLQISNVGKPVTLALRASGGSAPYRFAATNLPTGLSVNQTTGVVSGTPTAFQNRNVTVTVTDTSGRTAQVTFTWFVFP
ncbi:S8 family serine peptidase [Longispora urticae]